MEASKLEIVSVALADLTLDKNNTRRHGERNLKAIEQSLTEFGQIEPLVVQKSTGSVIGGNGRLSVLRKMGYEQAQVVYLDIGDEEAASLSIALNRTAELAEWDFEKLAETLPKIKNHEVVGFSADELNALLANAGWEGFDDSTAGAVEKLEKTHDAAAVFSITVLIPDAKEAVRELLEETFGDTEGVVIEESKL